MRIPILTYHLVREDLPSTNLVISKKNLEEQIRYLRSSGYVSISLQDLLDWIQTGKSLPPQPVILTFDDGYLDCYENAWPILAKYEMRFTVFLVSDQVGSANAWQGILSGELRLMDRHQIREMHAAGVSFGAHSCTHPSLIRLPDAGLRQEVRKCRERISEIIGVQPQFFAYPYGEFNGRVCQEVKAAGYAGACTTLHGLNDNRTDSFQLRRVQVSGLDRLTDFQLKLKLGYGLLSFSNLKRAANHLFREKKILRGYEA
jgi:peptidoglycan/xylan/chitin deacetylase (PgdA/CDA1 family)